MATVFQFHAMVKVLLIQLVVLTCTVRVATAEIFNTTSEGYTTEEITTVREGLSSKDLSIYLSLSLCSIVKQIKQTVADK
jgi:hypothetical protein